MSVLAGVSRKYSRDFEYKSNIKQTLTDIQQAHTMNTMMQSRMWFMLAWQHYAVVYWFGMQVESAVSRSNPISHGLFPSRRGLPVVRPSSKRKHC